MPDFLSKKKKKGRKRKGEGEAVMIFVIEKVGVLFGFLLLLLTIIYWEHKKEIKRK